MTDILDDSYETDITEEEHERLILMSEHTIGSDITEEEHERLILMSEHAVASSLKEQLDD